MAKYIQCDLCGKQSPDENGRHIANHWSKIIVKTTINDWESGYDICTDCLVTGNSPYHLTDALISFVGKLANYFKEKKHEK